MLLRTHIIYIIAWSLISHIGCKKMVPKESSPTPVPTKRYVAIKDYKGFEEPFSKELIELPLQSTPNFNDNSEYFRHIPTEEFVFDMIRSKGEAIFISESGEISTWDNEPINTGCYPYIMDKLSGKSYIYLEGKEVDEIIENFHSEYIPLSAGQVCLDDTMLITEIDNNSKYAPDNSASFLIGFIQKKGGELYLSNDFQEQEVVIGGILGAIGLLAVGGAGTLIAGKLLKKGTKIDLEAKKADSPAPSASKEGIDASNTAATTIQRAFRRQRAKLRLKTKERAFLNDLKVKEVIDKIDSDTSDTLSASLSALNNEELLFAFRYFVNKKDAQGRLTFSKEMQDTFEGSLIKRFSLRGRDFGETYFDVKGIKDIVEYHKIVNPDLGKYKIEYIFREDGKLPDLSSGTGEKFFIEDTSMSWGEISHVKMLYVNYNTKQAYSFDSIFGAFGGEIEKYRTALGKEFSLVSTSSKLQHDNHNCMLFATSGMSRLARYGNSLPARLKALTPQEGVRTIDILPETLGRVVKFNLTM